MIDYVRLAQRYSRPGGPVDVGIRSLARAVLHLRCQSALLTAEFAMHQHFDEYWCYRINPMPELPDIVVYIEALEKRILNRGLEKVTIDSPFLMRTAEPSINSVESKKVLQIRRIGKRICFGFEDDLWLVLHLMIAGRLHWKEGTTLRKSLRAPKNQLAAFVFENGTLTLTEAGTQRRASLHVIKGEANLANLDRGGVEIFETDLDSFSKILKSENHTLKRTLTDPRLFSGIGNAYSDEILWHAKLSPVALTQKLTTEEIERLFDSTQSTLKLWIKTLSEEAARR